MELGLANRYYELNKNKIQWLMTNTNAKGNSKSRNAGKAHYENGKNSPKLMKLLIIMFCKYCRKLCFGISIIYLTALS